MYKYGGKEIKGTASPSGASLDECRRITINALKVNDTLCTHMKCTFGGVWNGGRGGGQKNMFVASFFFDRAAEVIQLKTLFLKAFTHPVFFVELGTFYDTGWIR